MLNRTVLPEDFIALPPHTSREIRSELPHLVLVKDASAFMRPAEYEPLPIGQYQVQLTYVSDVIGFEVELPNDFGYVDLNPWVGRIESDPILLTVIP